MAGQQLPLRTEGQARGVGICLSGGGIRAASFGFGALQAFDAGKGLLHGREHADWLAAVSGGSYVAATATAISAQLAGDAPPEDDRPPLAAGTPEAEHILANGDYLKQWGGFTTAGNWLAVPVLVTLVLGALLWREVPPGWIAVFCAVIAVAGGIAASRRWLLTASLFGLSVAINLLGFASLAVLAAAGLVATRDYLVKALDEVDWLEFAVKPGLDDRWYAWLPLSVVAVLGARLFLRTLYRVDRPFWRFAASGALVLAGTPSLVFALNEHPVGAPALLAVALAFIALGSPRTWWSPRSFRDALLTGVAQLVGLFLLAKAIDLVRGWFERGDRWPLFLVMVVGGAVCSVVIGRVSLHHLNRNRLARCFCVTRAHAAGSPAIRVHPAERNLSGLGPPSESAERSFPRLLVCATANIDDRHASRSRWARFQPFIFSHDRCGLQTRPETQFDTTQLEAVKRPVGLGRQPLVTLMSAVASAGAVVSPSMGEKTRPGLRSLAALLNLRLGTWLPNPLSGTIQDEVRAGTWRTDRHWALGAGFDEFVPELFGLQRDDAARAYVSDGGHYDNLGLLALLRLRCKTIWCVDSQADKDGRAGQLSKIITLAHDENLFARLTLNGREDNLYDVFGHADGRDGAGHAIYDVEYETGVTGKLVVVKLGLTPRSSSDLREFNREDRRFFGKFPYDNTFARVAFSNAAARHVPAARMGEHMPGAGGLHRAPRGWPGACCRAAIAPISFVDSRVNDTPEPPEWP